MDLIGFNICITLFKSMIRQKAMMNHSIAVRGFAVVGAVFSWSGLFA